MNDGRIPFWKLTGSGNDFVCIDNLDGRFDPMLADASASARFAATLCKRGHGVGADGVIFAGKPEIEGFADIAARFFEADGSECELCGNGTACFTRFAFDLALVADGELKILTPAGVVLASRAEGDYIRVCIPAPENRRGNLLIELPGRSFLCDYALVGVPHLVTYVEDIERIDVARWGLALRHHHDFQPRGVNVNFVQVLDVGEIAVRTFEFGVEAETLACGTGSSASAIETALRQGWEDKFGKCKKPVLVHSRSGEILRVFFSTHPPGQCKAPCETAVTDVCLETTVRLIVRGELHKDFIAEACSENFS
jgi:diaminopimelate epimerase